MRHVFTTTTGAMNLNNAGDVLRITDPTQVIVLEFDVDTPVTGGGDAPFLARVPGAQGQAHTTVAGGGHFLQEDKGPQLAQLVNVFIAGTPAEG